MIYLLWLIALAGVIAATGTLHTVALVVFLGLTLPVLIAVVGLILAWKSL
jgi:hypothetical protein